MNELKNLAMKAKSRLLCSGLRNTYSNAQILSSKENPLQAKEGEKRKTSLKSLLDEEALINMKSEERKKYLLDAIMDYQRDSKKVI